MTNILDKKLKLIDEEIYNVFNEAPTILKPVMDHLKLSVGKKLRAKLMISLALDIKEKYKINDENCIIDNKVVKLAAATEIMHLSTLIHDDVIDDAPLRRGVASVKSLFGNKLAVIAGDYLYTKCFNIISQFESENMKWFSKTIELICIGEAYQLQNNKNFNINMRDYNKIIAGKTAVLFSLAIYSVAKQFDEMTEKETEILGKSGFYLGMMFQLVDDYLDYFSTNFNETKKEVFKDLKEGVVTYPLIYTLKNNEDLIYLLNNNFSDETIDVAINSVLNSNAKNETKEKIQYYYDLCKSKLNKVVPMENSNSIKIIDVIYNIQYK